jgi:hypothetical protein
MNNYEIILSWHEVAMAAQIGMMRQLSSMKKGLVHSHGCEEIGWTNHIEGACGELALSKYLGVYWNGSVDSFKSSTDIPGYEVRTRSDHAYDLIVRDNDNDKLRYALVTGVSPRYLIRGWILGTDAKREKWSQGYGNRPPAFFVPQEYLSLKF